MIDKIFLKLVYILNYSMADFDNKKMSTPKVFLQLFLPMFLFSKFIKPYFVSNNAFVIGIILLPVLFIGNGYIYNKLYEKHRLKKVN